MGKLSRADAEARGWVIFHEQEPRTEFIANRPQELPGSFRAEKAMDEQHKLTEEGETEELLLTRIHAAECNLEGVPVFANSEMPLPTSTVTDEEGNESEVSAGEVLVRDENGDITRIPEEVLASRSVNEAIVLPDEENDETGRRMAFIGPVEEAVQADQARSDLEQAQADEASAEPTFGPEDAENVQVENDTDTPDQPGHSGGSSLIVPKAPLGSQEYAEQDEAAVKGESSEIPDVHESAAGQAAIERRNAEEDKAKELRDAHGAKADAPEHVQEVREAGAEEAQSQKDEAEEQQDEQKEGGSNPTPTNKPQPGGEPDRVDANPNDVIIADGDPGNDASNEVPHFEREQPDQEPGDSEDAPNTEAPAPED